jgi:hypothetical protein
MLVERSIFEAINDFLSDKVTWIEFSRLFSSLYFDKKNAAEVENLSDIVAELFGEINDTIEYTDSIFSQSERLEYGLYSASEAKTKIIGLIKKYESQGLIWK